MLPATLIGFVGPLLVGTRMMDVPVPVNFQSQIRPILAAHCFQCHGFDADSREGGLRLDTREGALALLDSGRHAVVSGDPQNSELIRRIRGDAGFERMPPPDHGEGLSPEQAMLLGRWIEEGAEYARHWSFEPLARSEVPESSLDWGLNEIDAFVSGPMVDAGLRPSPEADPFVLARRLWLDLTGLPPTYEQALGFAEDDSPDAYETLVDQLLNSPRYGERWARVWLDQARYADSMGYTSDNLRTIWRYRDWVIEALNDNMPFDQFTLEQMAGDLLPNATIEQRLATAFHRNTQNNTEGGTDDEEFRMAAVKDRLTTSMQVWMGLSAQCAECHSHKYDPLTYREYYSLLAIFNQTADRDTNDDAPLLETPTREQAAEMGRIQGEIESLDMELASLGRGLRKEHSVWCDQVLVGDQSWKVLKPLRASSDRDTHLEWDESAEVRARGTASGDEVYRLEFALSPGTWRGVRLEAIGDAAGGPGRSPHGNFVINEVNAHLLGEARVVDGQRLRLSLPGEGRILSLAEVQVFSKGQNIAPLGQVSQSSEGYGGSPERAIDGNTDGTYAANSVTHTATEADPWWEVDWGEKKAVEKVLVYLRTDGQLAQRSSGLNLDVLDEQGAIVWTSVIGEIDGAESYGLGPSGDSRIALSRPSASFAQRDFSVDQTLDRNRSKESGWAVSPRMGQSHQAVFVLETPLHLIEPAVLAIELDQTYPDHALGRFRISASTFEGPLIALEASDRAALSRGDGALPGTDRLQRLWEQDEPRLVEVREERNAWAEKLTGYSVTKTPVLVALGGDQQRKTFTLRGGNFLNPVEEVQAGVPDAFHPLPGNVDPDRMGFAQWLTAFENPLTARVAVNRVWAQLFGIGLVETEENFGSRGTLPSHQGLLDWLAWEFMTDGWDQKALIKRIVMSAAYRQDSRMDAAALDADPRNRLLARGPTFRLEAEMVRDQALQVSGLLVNRIGGPSVFPAQPAGLWQSAFNGQRNWATSQGDDRYRRALYTFMRRNTPYPSMEIFDAPNRQLCSPRRLRTNTPLQAFVTLNDPAFVEAAQALGRRMQAASGGDIAVGVRRGLEWLLARPANQADIVDLVTLHVEAVESLSPDPGQALILATDPLGPLPEGVDPVQAAAWVAVGNVLLNLDAALVID